MKVDVIGTGNVGTHLAQAFAAKHDVNTVNSRSLDNIRNDADLYLLTVSDKAIQEVADRLKGLPGIIAHTSGSTPLSVLSQSAQKYGVLYPMQTFSKGKPLDYSKIPFFVEGSDTEVVQLLSDLALSVSDNVRQADSSQRRALHIASVFACNFVNKLWDISDRLLLANGLDFDILRPLIAETAHKAMANRPADVQTGPASRLDMVTVSKHYEFLSDNKPYQDLYDDLSALIIHDPTPQENA